MVSCGGRESRRAVKWPRGALNAGSGAHFFSFFHYAATSLDAARVSRTMKVTATTTRESSQLPSGASLTEILEHEPNIVALGQLDLKQSQTVPASTAV